MIKTAGANGGFELDWQSLVGKPFHKEVAMFSRNIRVESPEEALIVEQALAMYREMRTRPRPRRMARCCRWPKVWRWRVVES